MLFDQYRRQLDEERRRLQENEEQQAPRSGFAAWRQRIRGRKQREVEEHENTRLGNEYLERSEVRNLIAELRSMKRASWDITHDREGAVIRVTTSREEGKYRSTLGNPRRTREEHPVGFEVHGGPTGELVFSATNIVGSIRARFDDRPAIEQALLDVCEWLNI